MFIYLTFLERDTPSKYASAMLIYHVTHKLYHSNSGINFFLYCISGQKFRNDVKETLCSCFERKTGNEEVKSSNTEGIIVSQ